MPVSRAPTLAEAEAATERELVALVCPPAIPGGGADLGTLVMLESRRLGVVIEPHPSNLLAPKVNVFFDSRNQVYIRPETLDLSRGLGFGGGDKIVGHELPARWDVDPMRFLSVA